ncbi:siderophore-interacting protein [Kytococcus sp. Marseille-QA3725]
MQKGWQGAVLKVYGAKDFTVEVLDSAHITPTFLRLRMHCPELLEAVEWHPTMWLRLWFTDERGKPHQRAYTVVDPQPDGSFDLEVHVHDGIAARALEAARPGDRFDATVQGTGFTQPDGEVDHLHLVGDAASIPAIRTVLEAMPTTPATVWLELQDTSEQRIHVTPRVDVDVHRVERGDGTALPAAVEEAVARRVEQGHRAEADWFWLAPEAVTCRRLGKHLRKELGVPKDRVTALAYWRVA